MKALPYLFSMLALVGLLAGCGTPGAPERSPSEDSAIQAAPQDPVPEPIQQPEDPPDEVEPLAHSAFFELDGKGGTLTASIAYSKEDRLGDSFVLNRDFLVTGLVCDGEAVDPAQAMERIRFDGYAVNQYVLPQWEETLYVEYTGSLSGTTGYRAYIRETISEEFTLLRWETACYPLFAEDFHGLSQILDPDEPLRAEISVGVPEEYSVATPYPLIRREAGSRGTVWTFDGDLFNLNMAAAQYTVAELPTGEYYFLPGTDVEEMEALINPILAQAQQFLSDTWGAAEIPGTMRYIVIPQGYGAYAIPGRAVFIDEDAFASTDDMRYLIHEFIHLGWNATARDYPVRRSRFFDEGFTMYFQHRVMGHLLGEEAYRSSIQRSRQNLRARFAQGYDSTVPLVEYGQWEYGDLSYDMGPVLFDELAKLVGTDDLDRATRGFLDTYRDKPVTFELFAAAYSEQLDHAGLEDFWNAWLYSTDGVMGALAYSDGNDNPQ